MGVPLQFWDAKESRYYNLRPEGDEINFAVPHRSVCSSEMSPLPPDKISPGIINKLLSEFAKNCEEQKTYKICVDGKKINAAITNKHGDIDLWGYEQKPTLEERQTEFQKHTEAIETCKAFVKNLSEMHKLSASDLDDEQKFRLCQILRGLITDLRYKMYKSLK